jgi:hypothetical protein
MSNNFPTVNQEQTLGGVYRLGAVVRRSAAGVICETEFGEAARPAVVKIRFAENPGAERLVEQWRNAAGLSHPNLLRIYAAGFSELEDVPAVYVVMERADVSLAGVLMDRALSAAETRDLLVPLLSALRYLHQNGYAHGNLKPSRILALGDQVKLSSDSVAMVADGADAAEDIRDLGTLIVQCLTRQLPQLGEQSGDCILIGDSEPLKDILRHCLEPNPARRWTLDQVEARLRGPIGPIAAAVAAPVPVIHAALEAGEQHRTRQPTPRWIFGGLAALVLIVVLVGYWREHHQGASAAPIPAAGRTVTSPSWPAAAEIKASQGAANPAEPVKPSPVTGRKGRKGEGWSVVVAAYGSREAADKRERDLTKRWQKFSFTVVQQPEEKAPYLIVIGHNLGEDEADTLRKRAVASGIPTDTYIKKFQ